MTRPTLETLAHAVADLEHLGWQHDPNGSPRRNTGFPDLAALTNLLRWYADGIDDAREAAAYGPGVKDGYRSLSSQNGHGDIDSRTRDAYRKELQAGLRGLLHKLGQLVDTERQAAYEIGRYPDRSEQATG
jgi:hypothetical protein